MEKSFKKAVSKQLSANSLRGAKGMVGRKLHA
jgi:hypothetical protein